MKIGSLTLSAPSYASRTPEARPQPESLDFFQPGRQEDSPLRPFEREESGFRWLSAESVLTHLKSKRNALGWMASVSDTSLMGRWVLSHFGPAGSFGPLGKFGPFGQGETGNVSELITGHNWEDLQKRFTEMGGPLSAKGPLSERGPLGESFRGRLLRLNSATWSLLPGQPLGLLGPGGVDGPLGVMGPLGPNGAHGHRALPSGDYVDESGSIVRNRDLPWTRSEARPRELFEIYRENALSLQIPQDTSFMVTGSLENSDETDSFRVRSKVEQWVSFHVVPTDPKTSPETIGQLLREVQFQGRRALSPQRLAHWNSKSLAWFDQIGLELRDEGGKTVAHSASAEGPNWLQVRLPANREVEVVVRGLDPSAAGPKNYRLFTTGAGPEFESSDSAPSSSSLLRESRLAFSSDSATLLAI